MNSSIRRNICCVIVIVCLGIMLSSEAKSPEREACEERAALLATAESVACSAGAAVLREGCKALPPQLYLPCIVGTVSVYATCMAGVGIRYYDRLRLCAKE